MSATTAINMINVEVRAEDQFQLDKKAGQTSPGGYSWTSQLQTIPIGMDHQPEAFARLLRESVPAANTLRLTINAWSFDENSQLHPEFERFLTEAAKQGFQFVFAYADGESQELKRCSTIEEARTNIGGAIHDRMIDTWKTMLDWLDDHGAVRDAVYGLEAVNEPASYGQAGGLGGGAGEFIRLYGDHMADFARLVQGRIDAKVLVDGIGYAQNFRVLAETRTADGAMSVMDQIRAAAGDSLVWSAHLYPGWGGAEAGQSAEGWKAFIQREYGILGDDDVILTETNAPNAEVNATTTSTAAFWMARAWEAFHDAGWGIGWYPGTENGRSSFVRIDNGTTVKFFHPDSYAQGVNAFLMGDTDPAHAGDEALVARLLAGRVYENSVQIAGVDGFGFAAGFDGNDTLTGIDRAQNMLYGGGGNDLLLGRDGRDHLFGHSGDDHLSAGAGNDVLSGGDGADTLDAGTGADLLTGGRGADLFMLADGGADVITDFHAPEGDRLSLGGRVLTLAEMTRAAQPVDYDNDGVRDDVLISWTGGEVALLNFMINRPDGVVDGTEAADQIAVGYRDTTGDALTWKGGRVSGLGGNDTISGSASADTLSGGAGNDHLDGRWQNDLLDGGDGRDTLLGGGQDDTLHGGAGDDLLDGGGECDLLDGGLGNDKLLGGAGDDVLNGGDGADHLDGGSGGDVLDGGLGNDKLLGGAGDDRLNGGEGADHLDGGAGGDVLDGGLSDDKLLGGAGDDSLNGGDGADYLDGGTGNDVVDGGAGDDQLVMVMHTGSNVALTGGLGADVFDFRQAWRVGESRVVITDFDIGVDTFQINNVAGLDVLSRSRNFHGLQDVGEDCVLTFGDDTFIFRGHQAADLLTA